MRLSLLFIVCAAASVLGNAIAEPAPAAAPDSLAEPTYEVKCGRDQTRCKHPKSGARYCCPKFTKPCYGIKDGISCCSYGEKCIINKYNSYCKKKKPDFHCGKDEVKCKHPKSGKKHCCPKWTEPCFGWKDGVACCKKGKEVCVRERHSAKCKKDDYHHDDDHHDDDHHDDDHHDDDHHDDDHHDDDHHDDDHHDDDHHDDDHHDDDYKTY